MPFSPDPKRPPRHKDSRATKRACLKWRWCGCCLEPVGSGHHVYPRGQGGDDVLANIVPLCGSGTTGCHGLVENGDATTCAKLGAHILAERHDVIEYLRFKLGRWAAEAWMEEFLYIDVSALPV